MLRHVKIRQSTKNEPTDDQENVGEQHFQILHRGQVGLENL